MSLFNPNDVSRTDVRLSIGTIILLVLVSSSGCSDRLKTYPVQGRVQFPSGAPVRVGTVELKSQEHGVQARGTLETDGSFSLTTYEEDDGAVAGTHDCVIVQMIMTEGLEGHRPSKLGVIDPRYHRYATSGLQIKIEPNTENQITIEVEGIGKQPSGEHHHH